MKMTVSGREAFASTGGAPFDEERPAIVFVHGAGMDRTVWAHQARYFAHHGFSVLAVDLPGHGYSSGKPLGSIGELADWLVSVIEASGVREASLVGHSMGALASLVCAARHPDSVTDLALLGIAESMPVHPDLLAAAEANDPLANELVAGWSLGADAHRGGHQSPGLWMLGSGMRILERAAPGVLYADLVACNAFRDGPSTAAQVRCPTLFILGEADKMTPARRAQGLIDAIGLATVEVLAGTGHMMMTERPRQTIRLLEGFLTRRG